jgi:ribosomal-protein-serine acetyltransferase
MTITVNSDITLRSISLSHAWEIFETIDSQREYLGKWLPFVPFTKSINDTINYIESTIEPSSQIEEHVFVIHYNNKFAGIIGFKDTDKGNQRTEIGYWLSEPYQGKGIITCSVRSLITYAFNEMEINRVQIRCAVGNIPSKKVPQRLNFHFEGVERAGELHGNGKFVDLEVYSILKDDYIQSQLSNLNR